MSYLKKLLSKSLNSATGSSYIIGEALVKISSKNIKNFLRNRDERFLPKSAKNDPGRGRARGRREFVLIFFIFGLVLIISQKIRIIEAKLQKKVFMGGVPP